MGKTNTKLTRFFALAVIALLHSNIATAQMTFQSSRHIEPAYEGWRQNDDGTFSLIFGYFNENWEEQPNIPIGENNQFSPGDIDRGQPTHFLPRRNRFTFEVVVPADWGDKELVWTLTSPNGESRKAYASLQADYVIDNVVIASETGSLGAGTSSPESRSNQPPRVEILGDSPRSVRVGEDLVVRARVTDDGLPRPTNLAALEVPQNAMARMMRPPSRPTVNKINGLFLSWNVYRGPDKAAFSPPQVKPWEDTRTSANSPWGALWTPPPIPADGVYEVSVKFDAPGTYVLWARADDGGLYFDQYLTVEVVE